MKAEQKSRFGRYLDSLRFPVLLLLTAIAFVANVAIPDVIPFADEIILGLIVAVLARLKRKKPVSASPQPTAQDHE